MTNMQIIIFGIVWERSHLIFYAVRGSSEMWIYFLYVSYQESKLLKYFQLQKLYQNLKNIRNTANILCEFDLIHAKEKALKLHIWDFIPWIGPSGQVRQDVKLEAVRDQQFIRIDILSHILYMYMCYHN